MSASDRGASPPPMHESPVAIRAPVPTEVPALRALVEAEVGGVAQPLFYVAASDRLRGALVDYVLTACGEPTDRRT